MSALGTRTLLINPPLINGIAVYPLSEFDGSAKIVDWQKSPVFPAQASGDAETKWVFPERLAEQLGDLLDEVPPRPGEEALYDTLVSEKLKN